VSDDVAHWMPCIHIEQPTGAYATYAARLAGRALHDLLTTLPTDVVEAELRRCGHTPKSAVLRVGEVADGQDDQE
jgi:hypothetical protein